MVLVVLSALVYVVDKALDAQRLQDVPEVLLQGLLAVLVCKQNACFSFAGLSSSELVLVKDAACEVCGLRLILR